MSNTQSCVIVIPASMLEFANRLWVAQGLDSSPLPGNSFTIAMGVAPSEPDGDPPTEVTHYAMHSWADMARAQAWLDMPNNGGTLPPLSIDLESVGLLEADAVALCAAVDPWCRTGGNPMENFAAMTTARSLARVAV